MSTGEELYVLDDNKFVCKQDYLSGKPLPDTHHVHGHHGEPALSIVVSILGKNILRCAPDSHENSRLTLARAKETAEFRANFAKSRRKQRLDLVVIRECESTRSIIETDSRSPSIDRRHSALAKGPFSRVIKSLTLANERSLFRATRRCAKFRRCRPEYVKLAISTWHVAVSGTRRSIAVPKTRGEIAFAGTTVRRTIAFRRIDLAVTAPPFAAAPLLRTRARAFYHDCSSAPPPPPPPPPPPCRSPFYDRLRRFRSRRR